ncbi:MAG: AMP-binding protein, partial [Acidobacteriota bacterium]|nr:AMP-binding protein [Acidobacteriota bacterium]
MSPPSYVHGAADVPLLGETIGANLRRTAERHPELDALVVASQNFRATYREFWNLTTRLARALLARGIARGDRVGIWAPNRYEWVVAQYATARVGAVLVNVNPAYRAHELEYTLNQSGLRLLLHARRFRAADYTAIVGRGPAPCPARAPNRERDDRWGT